MRIVPDENQPSAAIEIALEKPLPDYDLEQLEQPTPRDVDGILVTQGFRDLVDQNPILSKSRNSRALSVRRRMKSTVRACGLFCSILRRGQGLRFRRPRCGAFPPLPPSW